jgi:hypothetical protein
MLIMVMLPGATLKRAMTPELFEQMTVDNTSGHRLVSDYKSRIAVRWDDIRDGAYFDIIYGLQIGVPISIAVIEDNIDAAGFMTTGNLTQIQVTADSTGTPLEWTMHSKDIFGGDGADPSDLTWANMQAQFNPTAIEAVVGQDIVSWSATGNPTALAWIKANRTMVYTELANNGIKYADCGYGGMAVSGNVVWNGNGVSANLDGGPVLGTIAGFIKPGHHNDPYFLPGAIAGDLGTRFIETGTWQYHEQPTGTPVADTHWKSSIGHPVYSAIGMGAGLVVALHDSLDTYNIMAADTGDISWIEAVPAAGEIDTDDVEGAWSAKLFMDWLKDLEDASLVDLVLCKEIYEWGLSDYEEGVNLLTFADGFKSPATIVGDTLGIEFPWFAGLGAPGVDNASWTAGMVNSGFDQGLGDVGKYDRAQDDPWDLNIEEAQGLNGRTAWTYSPSVAVGWTDFLIGSLPPGEWLFGFSTDNAGTSHSTRYLTLGLSYVKMQINSSWTGSMTPSYEDSIQVLNSYNQNITFAETVQANDSSSMFVHFTVPRDGGQFEATKTGGLEFGFGPNDRAAVAGDYDNGWWIKTGAGVLGWNMSAASASNDFDRPTLVCLRRF